MLFTDIKAAFYTMPVETALGALLALPSRRVALLKAGMIEQEVAAFSAKHTDGATLLQQWGVQAP